MLKNLKIRNFALIGSVTLDFDKGLNIITGETGAGKSILVDALMTLLGEKASPDYVRSGEQKAVVEAIFSFPKTHPVFELLLENNYDNFDLGENDYDNSDTDKNTGNESQSNNSQIIIRREILARGSSRSFVNDTPAQFNFLKELGSLLVDFHGQHEHQLLLKKENHIVFLDIIANNEEILNDYKIEYIKLKNLLTNLEDLTSKKEYFKIKAERQRFELKEINNVSPSPGEEIKLEDELSLHENSEKLVMLTSEVFNLLYGGDYSVNDKLASAKKSIQSLSEIDKKFSVYLEEIVSVAVAVKEIAQFIGTYKDNIDFEPERLEVIRERLTKIRGLAKKYGNFENIFDHKQKLEHELSLIDNLDEKIENTKNEIETQKENIGKLAKKISENRKEKLIFLAESVVKTLKELGIDNSLFRVLINQKKIDNNFANKAIAIVNNEFFEAFHNGIDTVEFLISTNAGEAPKPLAETASGGEISRVMLAIKSIIANSDQMPILVFDEIDSGISGRIARKVGLAMKKLADKHQIIAITHLPQIAALADQHISVIKIVSEEQTFINAKVLQEQDKIIETAKLISGDQLTEHSIKTAKELRLV